MKAEATVNGGAVGDGAVLRRLSLDGQNVEERGHNTGGKTNFTSVFMI